MPLTSAVITSGLWTPAIAGSTTAGTNTYTTNSGYWRLIARGMLFVSFVVQLATKDAAMAGNALITGLPFTVKNVIPGTGQQNMGVVMRAENLGAVTYTELVVTPNNGATTLALNGMAPAAGVFSAFPVTALTAATLISGACWFPIA